MSANFKRSATFAHAAFWSAVRPALDSLIPGLVDAAPVELMGGAAVEALDREGGIDALLIRRCVVRGQRLTYTQGLAVRVQPTARPWRTYTVRFGTRRHPSEFRKRCWAFRAQAGAAPIMAPALTLQAYVDPADGHLRCAAVARTVDVIGAVQRALTRIKQEAPESARRWLASPSTAPLRDPRSPVHFRRNRQDGKIFAVVPWGFVPSYVEEAVDDGALTL